MHQISTTHPHDIGDADVQHMAALSRDPELLQKVIAASREVLGFFPAHNPRALEYPWIVAELPQDLSGKRILDVGAGVNVVPFMLADRGAQVTTLDHHPLTRDPRSRQDWNEWGFLDYSLLDRRITSIRSPYEDWPAPAPFDCIYSVSVIEHVPRAVRLRWIENLEAQLQPGGLLLLTVDLVRETNALWNLCEGRVVEEPSVHGEFATLVHELTHAGFQVTNAETRRGIPNCRVDIGFIRAIAR